MSPVVSVGLVGMSYMFLKHHTDNFLEKLKKKRKDGPWKCLDHNLLSGS